MMRAALGMHGLDVRGGVRVLASREWPAGCGQDEFEMWEPELAPSKSLLVRRRNGMTDSVFKREYAAEIGCDAKSAILARLRRLDAAYGVEMCYGCDDDCCHNVLASMVYPSR